MKTQTRRSFRLLICLSVFCLFNFSLIAQEHYVPEWTKADHATTIPLRDMAPMKVTEGHREKPLRLIKNVAPAAASKKPVPDTALQTVSLAAPTIGNITSFPGVGQGDYGFTPNAAPPDTNGAVGDTQYVQWVNESFAVFDKSTGAILAGPTAGNTLFQALGATHPCAVHNDGDPIAQFDKAAHRWVMTQFSVTSGSTQGFWQCVAVSKTNDATGAYNVYAFNYGTVQFNDYPKLGVWNNAYLITYNIFNNGSTFAGSKLCAFDRAAMIAGTAATQICFQLSNTFGGELPADIDGNTAPPAGSPAYFMEFGTNQLIMFQMSNINFSAGTATLTGPINIPVAAFSRACNGGTCIPQAGTTTQLDSLADRLMYRLAYRNFGDHESIIASHSITSGTSAGVRWYEIRTPLTPTVFQQGTFAPDANFRWMSSAAQDSVGNIAMGYSVSSSSINPGIRFTARSPGDPLGSMGAEQTILNGTGSQTGNLHRWGDYSSLSVDPIDDCTMWYTTEFEKVNGSFNWSTRIANFKFVGCGTPDFALTASPASVSADQGTTANYTATVTPQNGFTGTVNLSISGLPAGATATFTPASLTSGNSALAISVGSTTPAGTYPLTITGTSGTLTHTANVTLVVTVPIVGDFTITASPASQTVTAGGSTSYTATITPLNGFNGTVTFSASGLPAGATASFNPASVAVSGTSTMTVTTSASTPAGTYTLTITGASGAIVHSTTVTLVVAGAPDFSISASPASQSITRGSTATYTVTITALNGFTGTVNLSVTGLPNRTTATFSPASVTGSGTSTLTITTRNNTPKGTRTLTITGVSGSLSHSTTVTLTIN